MPNSTADGFQNGRPAHVGTVAIQVPGFPGEPPVEHGERRLVLYE